MKFKLEFMKAQTENTGRAPTSKEADELESLCHMVYCKLHKERGETVREAIELAFADVADALICYRDLVHRVYAPTLERTA